MKNWEINSSRITEWAQGKTLVTSPPWFCYISVTNLCNNRCVVCAREKAMRKCQGLMDFELFKKIIVQLPEEIKTIYMMKQGEPFMHPKLVDMIAFVREKRPDELIALHTNGILATKEKIIPILKNVSSLGISISAITAETYRSVHGSGGFDVVIKNLQVISDYLLSIPEKKRPHVFIDYVKQKRNRHETQEDVIAFFENRFKGLNSVDFHWVFNFLGEIDEGNIKINQKIAEHDFPTCVFPWAAFTICHDGKVSYCFVEPKENKFLGDFSAQTFEQIWNGEKYVDFRKQMFEHRFSRLDEEGFGCKKCSWLWSMKAMSPVKLSARSPLERKSFDLDMGTMLDTDLEEIFEIGKKMYLDGEIHMAISCFEIIAATADGRLAKAADEMLVLAKTVLSRYKNLGRWQKLLKEESAGSRTNYYHKIKK